MSLILILLLSICRCLRCELPENPAMLANALEEDAQPADFEIVSSKSYNDKFLPDFISSINIDYANNALILHFRKAGSLGDEKQKLDKNFMRFGRSGSALMRFGKRQAEFLEDPDFQGSENESGPRDSRGDNFMRFGRSDGDVGNLMRFGRAIGKVDSMGNPLPQPQSSGRNDRTSDASMFRFGRGADSLMRFGRADRDFMRFGRNNGMMRFGRSDGFMRLGRAPLDEKNSYVDRYGRNDKNFMRFGKLDQNFMRFGKRQEHGNIEREETKKSIANPNLNYLDRLWKTDGFTTTDSKSDNASQ